MDFSDIFNTSLEHSKSNIAGKDALDSIKDKSKASLGDVLDKKNQSFKTDDFNSILKLLGNDFFIDGAIKIDSKKLEEQLLGFNIKDFDYDLLSNYTYKKGTKLIFRSSKYYFLFDNSIKVDGVNKFSSVNDFTVDCIDIGKFISDISSHMDGTYNLIRLFQKNIVEQGANSLWEKRDRVKRRIKKLLPHNMLENIEKLKGLPGFESVKLWDVLIKYHNVITIFLNNPSIDTYCDIISFTTTHKFVLSGLSGLMKEDYLGIVDYYTEINVPSEIKKLILGLSDAQSNILSFMQNIGQILSNKDFLNTDTDQKLIFSSEQTRYIKKLCPQEFKKFKTLQENFNNKEVMLYFLDRLNSNIGYFLDILIGDSHFGILRQVLNMSSKKYLEEKMGDNSGIQTATQEIEVLLSGFYKLLEEYDSSSKKIIEKREINYIKKNGTNKGFINMEKHIILMKSVNNKLIRLYREENDPLVMIKTAQNAFCTMKNKGYNERHHQLTFLGVNYGGALCGYYTRHIFDKCLGNLGGLNQTGNMVYSRYDLKNVNTISGYGDYPFTFLFNENEQKKIKDKTWLVIIDDNTHSGKTLYDLKNLSIESGLYGNVSIFSCRAGVDSSKFNPEVSELERLELLQTSGTITRQTMIGDKETRYKEVIGTIVGHSIFKEKNLLNKK